MTCSRCQTINPAGSVACASCGAPLMAVPPAGYQVPPQGYQVPPQGYQVPPQGYQMPGQPYVVMQPMMPQRSGTPKVMGILMIIFASLGLLGSLAGLGGASTSGMRELEELDAFKTYNTLSQLMAVIGLGLGALHLYAGIRAAGYRANAPRLATVYAIANMVTTAIWMILFYAWLKPAIDVIPGAGAVFGTFIMIGGVISLIWPILVISLMNAQSAKAACVN